MRALTAAIVLLAGCFSIPTDEQPTFSTHHIDLLKDAGRWDVAAGAGDAGVAPGQGDCGSQTCEAGMICLIVASGGVWEYGCYQPDGDRAPDQHLTQLLSQECIQFGERCQNGICPQGGHNSGCLQDTHSELRCFETRGSCGTDDDCVGRGDNNSNLSCLPSPHWQNELTESLRGRCAPDGMGYPELVGGAIGFWAVGRGPPICGLVPCNVEDAAASCARYLSLGDHSMQSSVSDVHAPHPVCSTIPGNTDAQQTTCDWRECKSGQDCQRKYLINNSECNEGGWCLAQGRFLNELAHGSTVGSEAQTGSQHCDERCGQGRVCVLENNGRLECMQCSNDGQCPDEAECFGDSCRYPCQSQGDCIWEENCNVEAGHCERGDGEPGGQPMDVCGQQNIQCPENTNCHNVMVRDGNQTVWQPVCQETGCIPENPNACQTPGSVCEQVNGDPPTECMLHGLCDDNDDCGNNIDCQRFMLLDNAADLCLDLRGPEKECESDEQCDMPGTTCLFGRLCGKIAADGCSDGLTSFGGFCPRPLVNSPCANHPCNGFTPNCAEVHVNVDGRDYARAACMPEACSSQAPCPSPFYCKEGDGPGRCEFYGFCNDNQECGHENRCDLDIQDRCLTLDGNPCLGDDECDPNECYAGFCAGPAAAAACQQAGGKHFAGACVPQ